MRIIIRYISLVIALCCFFACTQRKQPQQNYSEVQKYQPPKTVIVNNPRVVSVDTCPKPRVIAVPVKDGGSYKLQTKNGVEAVRLLPPEPKPAGFFVPMQTYTTDNGLALDEIECATMDKMGNLWFGTGGGGASRYDGKSFITYTAAQGLGNNVVWSIIEDKTGNLWFGTNGGGVSRYDGKSFITYTTAQGLADNTVLSIKEDKMGNLWFGTEDGGVSRYNGKSFITYTKAQGLGSNTVRCIFEDKTGNLWFGADDGGGVSRFDGKNFTTYTTKQGLSNNNVFSIFEDKTGNLWFGTFGGGVSCYDGKTFTTYTTAQGLANNYVFSITEDKTGNLWFGTYGGGVSRYDGKTFITFTTAQGLAHDNVSCITEDKTGNLWFGTGGGVSRYDGESFATYAKAQGVNGSVCSITEDKAGNLWFGTLGGALRYDGKTFTTYTAAQGLENNTVYEVAKDKADNLWFGTHKGVSRYDGKTFTTYTTAQGLGSNVVENITEDSRGNFWFSTVGGGVSRYDGKTFTTYTTAQGLGSNIVWSITEDKAGNLWFGTNGGGASCYDGKTFTTYTTAQGLGSNVVWSITEDKTGNLWFGTGGGGVSRYDGKTFTTYTTAQGLPDNNVTQVIITKEQNIALGTNLGIAVLLNFAPKLQGNSTEGNVPAQNNLNNGELKNYKPIFEIYNSAKGYPVKDINEGQHSISVDRKGIIWIGTTNEKVELIRFDPSAVHHNPNLPNVVLQSIKINEENVCWYDLNDNRNDSTTKAQQEAMTFGSPLSNAARDTMQMKFGDMKFDSITKFYPIPQNLVLPYKDNRITFSFQAIEPSGNFLVRYQYMLEGYDKDWSPVTEKNEASFANISEGTYTFKLKACSPFGIWNAPIIYTFKVLPPWYRTWWAYTLYGIIAFLILAGIFRWRTASLRHEKEKLEQTVKERTLEVEQQKDEAEYQRNEAEKQKTIVEEKNKDILDSIDYAKRLQDAILPPMSLILQYLPESFVLYLPKDIVAGDFYWMEKAGDLILIAAADCTGHGVPGAMVSVVCSNALNRTVKEFYITEPGKILDKVRELVLQTFEKSESNIQDGMDISLCSINTQTLEIQWSGANNPLWYIENGAMQKIVADKQPIGKHDNPVPFKTNVLTLQKGALLYLFTDGYADQFGGENGKKFKYKQLQEKILQIASSGMEEQKKELEKTLEQWKGALEQVDDMLVIGIRL